MITINSCGNCLREAMPLGMVRGKVCCWYRVLSHETSKKQELVWWWMFFWFPVVGTDLESIFNRPGLNLYLSDYNMLSLAFFLLDCSKGQFSSSRMAVTMDVGL